MTRICIFCKTDENSRRWIILLQWSLWKLWNLDNNDSGEPIWYTMSWQRITFATLENDSGELIWYTMSWLRITFVKWYLPPQDIRFSSNHNIHKSSSGHCFWTLDLLIDGFYQTLSIKGFEAQKQWPDKLLWMLWFDEKSISSLHKDCKFIPYLFCFKSKMKTNWFESQFLTNSIVYNHKYIQIQ